VVDQERLGLNGGVWDEVMAGYLVSGDAERGKRCEIEKWHSGCNRR
jgi:hypothetical protein